MSHEHLQTLTLLLLAISEITHLVWHHLKGDR